MDGGAVGGSGGFGKGLAHRGVSVNGLMYLPGGNTVLHCQYIFGYKFGCVCANYMGAQDFVVFIIDDEFDGLIVQPKDIDNLVEGMRLAGLPE